MASSDTQCPRTFDPCGRTALSASIRDPRAGAAMLCRRGAQFFAHSGQRGHAEREAERLRAQQSPVDVRDTIADVSRPLAQRGALPPRAPRRFEAVATESEVGGEAHVGAEVDEVVEVAIVELLDHEVCIDREAPNRMPATEVGEATSPGERFVE